MPWDPPDLETDPDAVTTRILDGLVARLPGWVAYEGDPLAALGEEVGRESAITNARVTQPFIELSVAGMGQTAFGFPAYGAETAEISVNLTVSAFGDVVPAGLQVVGVNESGTEVAFTLLEEITASTTTESVTMTAAVAGDVGNGVPAGPLTVVTATATVLDATAAAPSTGGADAESVTGYLDRFIDYVATLRPGGVRAQDLASLARSVPGVYRCLGVDLYDPAAPGTPAERTATVFPIGEDGAAVTGGVVADVQALLEASREVNFLIHVAAPTYTTVHVVYTAVAEPGNDPAVVEAAIDAAVAAWLSGFGSTADDETAWEPGNTVRYLDLARVAGSVPGVAFLSSMTINGAAADLVLSGVAPLPKPSTAATGPSTVAGTVT